MLEPWVYDRGGATDVMPSTKLVASAPRSWPSSSARAVDRAIAAGPPGAVRSAWYRSPVNRQVIGSSPIAGAFYSCFLPAMCVMARISAWCWLDRVWRVWCGDLWLLACSRFYFRVVRCLQRRSIAPRAERWERDVPGRRSLTMAVTGGFGCVGTLRRVKPRSLAGTWTTCRAVAGR